jgi:hypothetical protein
MQIPKKQTYEVIVQSLLDEAKQKIDILSVSLPKEVKPIEQKTAYNAICYREGLIYRTEELARGAYNAFLQRDVVNAITLTRALIETIAAIWYFMKLIEKPILNLTEVHEKILRLLVNHKTNPTQRNPINIISFLDAVEKEVPGIKKTYDNMSEYAHPNWSGTMLIYSKINKENFVTYFSENIKKESAEAHMEMGLNALVGSIEIFEIAYNRSGDLLPTFIKECEKSKNT